MKNNKLLVLSAILSVALAACGKQNATTDLAAQNSLYPNGVYPNGVYPGGCMPLNQQLSFSAQGASINDIAVLAGNMPQNSHRPGNYGQVQMGYGYANQYGYGAPGTYNMNKAGTNGSIQMTVSAPSYTQNITQFPGAPATISGVIQLSAQILQALQAQSGYLSMPYQGYPYGQIGQYPGYNTGYPQYGMANCITSVGFEAVGQISPSYYGAPGSANVWQVLMYLYMNNSSTPTPIIL